MPHTLTIEGLNDFEAEHIAQILANYRADMLMNKVMGERETGTVEWIDAHLEWHSAVMKKVVWTKSPP